MKGNITKKQAGVIYSNWKRGNLNLSQDQISVIYDWADSFVRETTDSKVADCVDYLRAAVDAIFADNLAEAQNNIDAFFARRDLYWTVA